MTTNKNANTSIYLEPKLKMKAQLHGMRNGKSLTTLINEALHNYLKS